MTNWSFINMPVIDLLFLPHSPALSFYLPQFGPRRHCCKRGFAQTVLTSSCWKLQSSPAAIKNWGEPCIGNSNLAPHSAPLWGGIRGSPAALIPSELSLWPINISQCPDKWGRCLWAPGNVYTKCIQPRDEQRSWKGGSGGGNDFYWKVLRFSS